MEVRQPTNALALARAVVIIPSGARVLRDCINQVCSAAATVYQREIGSRCFD
jgi:inactivated superfamily I helicase